MEHIEYCLFDLFILNSGTKMADINRKALGNQEGRNIWSNNLKFSLFFKYWNEK